MVRGAVREAMAQFAASKFQSEVFAHHGAPKYLISDSGTALMNSSTRWWVPSSYSYD